MNESEIREQIARDIEALQISVWAGGTARDVRAVCASIARTPRRRWFYVDTNSVDDRGHVGTTFRAEVPPPGDIKPALVGRTVGIVDADDNCGEAEVLAVHANGWIELQVTKHPNEGGRRAITGGTA